MKAGGDGESERGERKRKRKKKGQCVWKEDMRFKEASIDFLSFFFSFSIFLNKIIKPK